MLQPKDFYDELKKHNITFFTGVPDSLLKDFCAYVTDNTPKQNHVLAANEGNAVALAAGHYMATGNPGLVYMQNSGQGIAANPLISLTDKAVYNIPSLLLIGWRGEPGKKDEPQHVKQGELTLDLLNTLQIPYAILPDTLPEVQSVLENAVQSMTQTRKPYALVVRKETFDKYKLQNKVETDYIMSREEAIKAVADTLEPRDIIVSTTGKTSRELFEYREAKQQGHEKDFLTVGSMGHSASIAAGIALAKPDRNIYCLDGDGALIMHMGSLAVIGQQSPKNFSHIVFNNQAHDSVGGQPTAASNMNIPQIALASGYKQSFTAQTPEEVKQRLDVMQASEGPNLLEIKVNKGAREDLGRPTTTPQENRDTFMGFLK